MALLVLWVLLVVGSVAAVPPPVHSLAVETEEIAVETVVRSSVVRRYHQAHLCPLLLLLPVYHSNASSAPQRIRRYPHPRLLAQPWLPPPALCRAMSLGPIRVSIVYTLQRTFPK